MAQQKLTRRSLLRRSGISTATSVAGFQTASTPTLDTPAGPPEFRTAVATSRFSTCGFCGVGCSTRIHVRRRDIINIEGNTDDIRFNGSLCARGAALYQIHKNPYRGTGAMYREAGATTWQRLDLDEAIEMVAQRIAQTRNRSFRRTTENGAPLNATTAIASIGGARMSNEANYLLQKLLRGLGIVRMEASSNGDMHDALDGLRTRLGYGASTTTYDSIDTTDAILLIGTDPGEEHPVLMQQLMRARARGISVISTESVVTRTSPALSLQAPIRPGTEIAFIGAIIRLVIEDAGWQQSLFHRRYLDLFTDAASLVNQDYRDTEDQDGTFSGMEDETLSRELTRAVYNTFTWTYQTESAQGGQTETDNAAPFDDTLNALPVITPVEDTSFDDRQTVYQILRRHFSRYTPELVSRITGCPAEAIQQVASELLTASTPERTTLVMISGGRGHGAQMSGALALLQLLLGNIGRPGGGVLITGPDVNSQGSHDVGPHTRFLPGHLPAPSSTSPHAGLVDYVASESARHGDRSMLPAAMMSFLVAMYGENATAENDWGYDWFPRLPEDVEEIPLAISMERMEIKGLLVFNDNPAAAGQNSVLHRNALRNLDWLVVKDLAESETAAFWKNAPELASEDEPGERINTEVFYFPSAQIGEQTGSWTNAERRISWNDTAVDPAFNARSDAWFLNRLVIALRAEYSSAGDSQSGSSPRQVQGSTSQLTNSEDDDADPFQFLAWDYNVALETPRQTRIFDEPSIARVHAEINGFDTATGDNLEEASKLADDGSTACGCWHYTGMMPTFDTLLAARRGQTETADASENAGQGPWGFVWPADVHTLYNRASADEDGQPWSDTKALGRWDAESSRWTGSDVPHVPVGLAPDTETDVDAIGSNGLGGDRAFRAFSQGRGLLFSTDNLANGPLPTFYEPIESPVGNLLYAEQHDPLAMIWDYPENRVTTEPTSDYPHLVHLSSLAEHHTTGELTRWAPWLNEQQPAPFCEISPSLAVSLDVFTRDFVLIFTPRATIYAQVLVTPRVLPLTIDGTTVEHVALPRHWGYQGLSQGPVAHDITPFTRRDDISAGSHQVIMARLEKLP